MSENEILDLIIDWFSDYAANNTQRISVDTDGIARINGEFDLRELAEKFYEEI